LPGTRYRLGTDIQNTLRTRRAPALSRYGIAPAAACNSSAVKHAWHRLPPLLCHVCAHRILLLYLPLALRAHPAISASARAHAFYLPAFSRVTGGSTAFPPFHLPFRRLVTFSSRCPPPHSHPTPHSQDMWQREEEDATLGLQGSMRRQTRLAFLCRAQRLALPCLPPCARRASFTANALAGRFMPPQAKGRKKS